MREKRKLLFPARGITRPLAPSSLRIERRQPGVGLETQDPIWVAQAGPDRLALFLGRMRTHAGLACAVVLFCVAVSAGLAFLLPSYLRIDETLVPVTHTAGGYLSLGSLAGLAAGGSGLSSLLGHG